MKRIKSKKNIVIDEKIKKKAHCNVETRSRNIRNQFIQKINKKLPFVLKSIKKIDTYPNNKEITIEKILSESLSYLNEINKILTKNQKKLTFENEKILLMEKKKFQ
ncbi:hypothetical protein DDB_G0290463 [Dictyostelium discoideum AX4]|uniref:Uncharacterized protein n=1 Tax=Dictyostelium discoideum TaxID=44689 RepID=Q54G32_DICDI|nr:hypothetical protein DDB_G0290463 [Dictyostelium discoideum AX4]EAL62247.1 hypothetical protein DDB_G0290463 [Dictyostelium discoideum AX4]|eukprot:XP_635740.1 hypothetical protein DDB_G0290463 [Dictyostelium discoideum AX4]